MREKAAVIETKKIQPDQFGGWITSRDVVCRVWCQVEELTGARAEAYHNTDVTHPVQFTIRAGAYKLTEDHILRYRDREYKIHSISNDHLRRYQIVVAYG
jgi:head-tail adaptor